MIKFHYLLLMFSLSFFFCHPVFASIVLQGNRVIIDASTKSKALKFSNNDDFPYIVQVWSSLKEDAKSSDKNSAPFFLSPTVFKMQPKADQIVNMIYTHVGEKLAKEQLYYLHFVQLPAISDKQKGKNKLIIVVNNTVKIFVRPDDPLIPHDDLFNYVNFDVLHSGQTCHILLRNQSPYYLNSVSFSVAGQPSQKIEMVAPDSHLQKTVACAHAASAQTLLLSYVNDYGAVQQIEIKKNKTNMSGHEK